MSTAITALSLILIGFGMLYPIFFIISARFIPNNKSTQRFLQLNYIIHLIAGGISVALFWIFSINYSLQLSGLVYLAAIVVVVFYYWSSQIPKWNLFGASIIFGFILFVRAIREIVQLTPLWPGVLMGAISTGILAITIFLCVLTARNRNINNIRLAIVPTLLNGLIILLGVRLVWDMIVLFSVKIGDQNGIMMNVFQFFIKSEIIYFLSTVICGLIVPLIILFIWMKLRKKLKNKTILILSSVLVTVVLLGEMLYKYFMLQYGIVL